MSCINELIRTIISNIKTAKFQSTPYLAKVYIASQNKDKLLQAICALAYEIKYNKTPHESEVFINKELIQYIYLNYNIFIDIYLKPDPKSGNDFIRIPGGTYHDYFWDTDIDQALPQEVKELL